MCHETKFSMGCLPAARRPTATNISMLGNYVWLQINQTNQMHQCLRFIARRLTLTLLTWKIRWAPNNVSKWQMGFNSAFKGLNTAQHVSGILMPIIRSLWTAVAAFGLPLERGGSSVVGRGRSDRTDRDQRHRYHYVPTVNQRRLLQFISSWWWAWGCPKHVELYLNDEQ